MEKINISKEQVDLPALLKRVEETKQGVLLSMDDGTRVTLLPSGSNQTGQDVEALVDRLIAFRERSNITLPEGMTIKDMVEHGRR